MKIKKIVGSAVVLENGRVENVIGRRVEAVAQGKAVTVQVTDVRDGQIFGIGPDGQEKVIDTLSFTLRVLPLLEALVAAIKSLWRSLFN